MSKYSDIQLPSSDNPSFFYIRPKLVVDINNELTPYFNKLHNLNFSNEFWLKLLNSYISTCINRKQYLSNKNSKIRFTLKNINSFKPLTTKQIVLDFFSYLYKASKVNTNKKSTLELINKNTIICLGLRGSIISKYIQGTYVEEYFPFKEISMPNLLKRYRLRRIAKEIDDIYLRNIFLSLPMVYVEYFKDMFDSIEVKNAPLKSFHYEHKQSIFTDFLIAKYRLFGSKIITYQTGAFMGEWENHPNQLFYSLIDELHTYGWKINEKDIPDRAYRLEEYEIEWNELRKKCIPKNILIVYSTINNNTLTHYKSINDILFKNLNPNILENIIVRPRPISRHIDNSSEAKKLGVPEIIKVDNGKIKMVEAASKAKLVIITSLPATNLLECIRVNQPVVALNFSQLSFNEEYKNHISNLKELEIIYDDVESLLNFINNLDVNEWWEKVIVDKKYLSFKENYTGLIV
jgi:putative transferase (TIGR04331 family)